jgi:hypothetical protein
MKKSLLSAFMLLTGFLLSIVGKSQLALAPDQNPNFAVSRDKYMKMADSLNAWHSTTLQENYKAIDWLADRKEARADRREFRQQLRLERARWDNDYYYDSYDYYPSYRNRRGYYDNNYYNNNRNYRGHRSTWGFGLWWH